MLLNDSSLASFNEENAAAVMFSIKVSFLYKLLYSALSSLELFHTMTSLEFFRRVLAHVKQAKISNLWRFFIQFYSAYCQRIGNPFLINRRADTKIVIFWSFY